MQRDLLEKIGTYIEEIFSTKLPRNIYYHNIAHTKNVVQQARVIGELCNISKIDLFLLEIAAWFHDIGFIKKADGHEKESAILASQYLKNEGLSAQAIEVVRNLILATQFDVEPNTELEQILVDADVSYLGNTNYFEMALGLRKEWEAQNGKDMTKDEWYGRNIAFFENQQYYTEAAKGLYANQKAENLKQIHAEMKKR